MLKREEIGDINQTEFVDQAVFLEEEEKVKPSLKDIKNNKNLLPFYILVVVIILLVLTLVISSILKRQVDTDDNSQLNETTYEELDPLTQRVRSLENELDEADPTRQSLPFPQVDLEFNID